MQKILNIIKLTLLLICFSCVNVFAEEADENIIKCEYNDIGLTMTWDVTKGFDTTSNPYVQMSGFNSSDEYSRFLLWRNGKKVDLSESTEIDQNLYKELLNNYGCNDGMKVCIYTEVASDTLLSLSTDLLDALFSWNWDKVDLGGKKQKLVIMTEKEYRDSGYALYDDGGGFYVFGHDQVEKRWDNGYNFGDVVLSLGDYLAGLFGSGEEHHTYVFKETSCVTAKYNGPYLGVNINCGILNNKVLRYIKVIESYKNCGDSSYCKADAIGKLNNIEDEIKTECRTILEYYNYSEGEKYCIDSCLSIKDTLNEYRKGTDLYEDSSNVGECNVSARLLVWVSNILRWIKYILPVVVILLSILDFIKAIGSDKDDEMKKAQGRFIKRLIAAALVFLVPLVLEFVLDKMGFGYDDCGLF